MVAIVLRSANILDIKLMQVLKKGPIDSAGPFALGVVDEA